MTHKDKQDVIAICNILADKMSDSGKVAVQQIIDAVKDMVENEPCEDAVSRQAVLNLFNKSDDWITAWIRRKIEKLPTVKTNANWIPIKTRPMTEKEKEEIGHEYAYMYDCPLPDDAQDVLITDCYGNVEIDTFCRDPEGFYFETNCDDDEVVAWMPKPESYKEGKK